MLFFTLCIAPVVSTVSEREISSKLLRKIFPRNFVYGLLLSLALVISSFLEKNSASVIFSSIILIFYLLNLFFLMPKINKEADLTKKQKTYSKRFKFLHLISVILYAIQIILSLIAILKFSN